jgi:hypothetical protein
MNEIRLKKNGRFHTGRRGTKHSSKKVMIKVLRTDGRSVRRILDIAEVWEVPDPPEPRTT